MNLSTGTAAFRQADGETLSIAVTGDICPMWGGGADDILAGNTSRILGEIQPVLDKADMRVVQWEVVLTDHPAPILKCGPNLNIPTKCVDFLKEMKVDVALLANNHSGDHGEEGIISTMNTLTANGIPYVGAGRNEKDAARPLHLVRNGLRVSILNFCEMEFGCSWGDHAGTNAMQELDNVRQIRDEWVENDIVLVVVHGGNEYNPVASPRMKRTYRAFAEAGASAVIGIHTHCPQGMEIYNGTPIIYSLGNFFFPEDKPYNSKDFWWTGYLPTLHFDKNGAFSLDITPYTLLQKPWHIHPLSGAQKAWMLAYLEKLSTYLEDSEKWFDIWCAYRYQMPFSYIRRVHHEELCKDCEDAEGLHELPPVRHMMTCQAHCELTTRVFLLLERRLIKSLSEKIPELEDLRTAKFGELTE